MTATETPQPQGTLMIRRPSDQQLRRYLQSFFPDLDGFYPDNDLGIVYKDINGDGQADLISHGIDGVFVLIWSEQRYLPPFGIQRGWSRAMAPQITIAFQDWTGDQVPEIVYDETGLGGGSGLWIELTSRSLIHCSPEACRIVWKGTLSRKTDDLGTGGLAHYKNDLQLTVDKSGRPAVQTLDSGFSIYCCSEQQFEYPVDNLTIFTSTQTLYVWTGETFELGDQQIVSPRTLIDSQASLSSKNSDGIQADIAWEDNYADRANEVCQLLIDDQPIGSHFGCRHKFTQVKWKDITNDRQDEIIITTYSASEPYGPEDLWSNAACMHQRLMAYQWDRGYATEIVSVAGCVTQSDLYGVRLADDDQDGSLEIFAAPLWLMDQAKMIPNRVYRWNGEEFVWKQWP